MSDKPELIETFAWNTGRKYTSAGQRIAAARMTDGTVWFYDVDRMITGQIVTGMNNDDFDWPRLVMTAYDNNIYRNELMPNDLRVTLREMALKQEL